MTCSKIPFSRIGHVQLFLFIPGRMHVSIHNFVRLWNYKHVACKKHSQEWMGIWHAHTLLGSCFLSHTNMRICYTHTHTHACIALEHTIRVLCRHIKTHILQVYTHCKCKGSYGVEAFCDPSQGQDKSSGNPFLSIGKQKTSPQKSTLNVLVQPQEESRKS